MSKKIGENGEKIVVGIANRRKSGTIEREILLVKDPSSEIWEFPNIGLKNGEDGAYLLEKYFRKEIVERRADVLNYFHDFFPNGKVPKERDRRTIETYLVFVRERVDREKSDVKWFDGGSINGKDYPITRVTERIVNSLKEEGYL